MLIFSQIEPWKISLGREDFMPKYHLLERVFELFAGVCLNDVLVIACQHLLNDQKKAFELLLKAGLKAENCIIIGKGYSTNKEVLEALRLKGCILAPFSAEFDPLKNFDDWFQEKISNFLKEELSSCNLDKYHKVIILDDGGFVHQAMDKIYGSSPNLVGIEQTSSGYHRIRQAKIQFRSIPIARTFHKLTLESPFITENGYGRIARHLQKRGKSRPNILVIGLGAIGRQIAGQLFLLHGHNGKATDIREDAWDIMENGVTQLLLNQKRVISLKDALKKISEFDVIVAATGSTVLSSVDIDKLHPEVSLISLSSSDREFPATLFRQTQTKIHDDCWLRNKCLVNSGFPITFDGTAQVMPPKQIEMTLAMMFSCLLNEASDHKYHLPSVINQLLGMWKPY
jgi:hypothetical protein